MNRNCLVWNRAIAGLALAAASVAPMFLLSPVHAQAVAFLDFSGGLSSWTTAGTVSVLSATDSFDINGSPYTLTPATGNSMAKISPSGAGPGSVDSLLGLGANSIESLLNNGNGNVTNFGVITKSYSLNPGTYAFSWAYAATDYQPFNDGVLFSVVGGGSATLVSLARNGSDANDASGPSAGTLILGSFGTVPWQTATFTVAVAGAYQVGFADYNWGDTSLDPIFYVSGTTGTATGTPPPISGPVAFDTTSGDVSASVFDTASAAYSEPTLTFDGGTLQYGANTTTAVDGVLTGNGGTIDTQTYSVNYAGSLSGVGALTETGTGTLMLSAVNLYTGATVIDAGATLALAGIGSIATSSGIADNGTFDISAASAGASVQSLSGAATGSVVLGNQNLTLTNAAGIFSGGIAGAGGLTVSGGAETFAGTNSYTGATTIGSGATLALSGAGSIAASSGITDNGTLDISAASSGSSVQSLSGGAGGLVVLGNNALTLSSAHDTFAGSIGGNGGLAIGGGTETLAGISGYTGATSIDAGGMLALTGAGSIATSSGVVDNGSFDISAATAGAAVKSLTGNGTVALGAQKLTLTNANGTFAGSINGNGAVELGGGVETLTGASSYSGGTIVTGAGKLIIASDAALGAASGPLTLSNGTLENSAPVTSSRKLNVAGAVTLVNDPGTSLELDGAISGSAAVTKNGDGTLVLGGDNRNWGIAGNSTVGGLTVNAGLVEITNAYALGYGPVVVNSAVLATTVDILTAQTIQFSGATVLNTAAGTTTTLTGTVLAASNGSCFDKTGTGTLVISGNAYLGNGTCVEQGKLSVNGILTSTVAVAPSGTLRGTGLINGPVTVRGTLAAGNSPGTLAVAGTVTMAAGGTYQEDINGTGVSNGPGNYSRLVLTGAAAQFIAGGATLNANLLNITGTETYTPYVPKFGDTFRIITAGGGIVGKFATFNQPGGLASGTRLAIFYDYLGSDSIDLRLVPTSYATLLHGSGSTANARSAGGALDRILAADQAGTATAAQNEVAYEVSGLTIARLSAAMTALAGDVHADLAAIAPQGDQWLQGSIERQLESGSAIDNTGTPLPGHALWLDTSANHGKWRDDDQALGFSDNHTHVAVGFELLADQPARIGIGFLHSLADISSFEASGSDEANTGFLYGQYSLGPAVLDGMVGAGGGNWESTRRDPLNLTVRALRASGHNTSSLGGAGMRWPVTVGDAVLEPYARVLWQRSARGSFDEGATPDALSGPSYAAHGLRSLVGISAGSENGSPLAATFTYRVNVGIGNDDGDLAHPAVSETLAHASFTVAAPDVGRTFAQLALAGTARIARHGYVYLGLSDEARRGKSQETGLNLGARANF